MKSDKVLLTYKRKRFSYQTDAAHATEATDLSPSMQRGFPWISSPKSECDASDEKPKNLHSEKCHCSPFISRCGFTESVQQHTPATSFIESMQQHTPATKGTMQITVQKDMGPMVLRSHRALNSLPIDNISKLASSTGSAQNNMEDVIQEDVSGRKSELDYGYLTPLLTVHKQRDNLINLNVSLDNDGDSCECPEVGIKMNSHSDNDNLLWNGKSLKEHSVAQLITFSRRTKPKQDPNERILVRNLKTAEKLSFSYSCDSHVIGANLSCEDSSKRYIEKQVNCSPVRLENCVIPSSQIEVADENELEMADNSPGCLAEFCAGSKIKPFKSSSESLTSVNTREELPKELLAGQPIDAVEGHIYPRNTLPSNCGNNAFSFSVEDSGSKMNLQTKNSEKRAITFLTEGDYTAGLDLSIETKKKYNEVPENQRDSQTSSTPAPSFSFVLTDEENDARNKEIEWLESLENILRKRREDRGACSSSVVHDVKDRSVGSTPIMPNNTADQSVKDIAIDFVNQLSFSQRISSTKLPFPSSVEQHKSDKLAPFTDFLSCYWPSKRGMPLDLNAATPSSGSHFRDKDHIPGRKLPYPTNLNPSLFMHKRTEKASAEKIPSGRRDYFSVEQRSYFKEWSEEELDFLWVGVRRHGVDNWKAILWDPKLHFTRSRFPEDLAFQWVQEQKKLFSQTNTSSSRLPDGRYPASAHHAYVENPMPPAETKLSLGGVYLQNENTAKSPLFSADHPPATTTNSFIRPLHCSYSSMCSHPGSAAMRHKQPFGASKTIYPLEYGSDKQQRERSGNTGLPAGTNLPHWLKEVYSQRAGDIVVPWPPFLTAGAAASMASFDLGHSSPTTNHCEPLASSKDLRGRGILKRKGVISQKHACFSRIEEASASIEPSAVLIPSERSTLGAGAFLQKNITVAPHDGIPAEPVMPNDLVVIDSDDHASSEETISDDQNLRPYQDQEQVD